MNGNTTGLPSGIFTPKLLNELENIVPSENNEGDPDFAEELDNENFAEEDIKATHDPNLLESDRYEAEGIRFIAEVSTDETIDDILFYINNWANLSPKAKARLSVFSACFQSKNTVFSVFSDNLDYLKAFDDLKYIEKILRIGLTRYDRNVDWLNGIGLVESMALLRLRQSKGGLARKQLNTTVSESVHENRETKREEERKLRGKIPLIGQFL